MPTATPSRTPEKLWELESDLPSLANQAAIELDHHRLGRSCGFEAVRRLASKLEADIMPPGTGTATPNYDPIMVGVVNRAIDALVSDPAQRPTELSQVIKFASELADRLRQVSDNPDASSKDELAKLRGECLKISESASGMEWTSDDNDPRHRFRS